MHTTIIPHNGQVHASNISLPIPVFDHKNIIMITLNIPLRLPIDNTLNLPLHDRLIDTIETVLLEALTVQRTTGALRTNAAAISKINETETMKTTNQSVNMYPLVKQKD